MTDKMRIYIESTIPSYVVARPARDLIQAAHQQLSKDWWDLEREKHELFTSQVVLDEIACGEAAMARKRLDLMANVPILPVNSEAEALTQAILDSGLLPVGADRDAAHIALATVYDLDILLNWNCRHISNAAIQSRLRDIAARAGFNLPVLCTPAELTGELYE
jgi:predicted nucleic acid-binding protein